MHPVDFSRETPVALPCRTGSARYRGKHPAGDRGSRRGLRILLAAAAISPLLGACSAGLPLLSQAEPELTTASIAPRSASPLAPLLRPEEWEASIPALVRALDPAGKGAAADWSDKAAGVAVAYRAQGEAYVRNDQLCRTFTAEVTLSGTSSSHLGTACRVGAGEWTVQKMKPWTSAG